MAVMIVVGVVGVLLLVVAAIVLAYVRRGLPGASDEEASAVGEFADGGRRACLEHREHLRRFGESLGVESAGPCIWGWCVRVGRWVFGCLAVAGALVGCGDASEPASELPAASHGTVGAVPDDVGGDVVDESTVDGPGENGTADSSDDPVAHDVDDAIGDDIERHDNSAVAMSGPDDGGAFDSDDGVIDEGLVDDAGEDAADDDVVVGDVLGMLVEGVCGWPGPLCAGDEAVAPLDEGGILWSWEGSKWDLLVGRVLDLCDDYEAHAAVGGIQRVRSADEEIDSFSMELIREYRQRNWIVCSEAEATTPNWKCWNSGASELQVYLAGFAEPPETAEVMAWVDRNGLDCFDAAALGRRYVYVSQRGPLEPSASVEEAVANHVRVAERSSSGPSNFPPGPPLGRWGFVWAFPVQVPTDEVVVLERTVSVMDGVIRGLAQNRSESLWARNVEIKVIDPVGSAGVWRFPLAVQPGEVLPFEIERSASSDDPSEIDFEVSAYLSPRIDLSRSLKLTGWEELIHKDRYLKYHFTEMAADDLPDSEFPIFQVHIAREAPIGHPRLIEAARQQVIEDLVVYGATFARGVVIDVFELVPREAVSFTEGSYEWVEISSIPTKLPDGEQSTGVTVEVILSEPLVWAGGATMSAESTEWPTASIFRR